MKTDSLLKKMLFIVALGAIVLGVFSIFNYIRGPQIYDVIEYNASLEVTEGLNLGIDTSTSSFGLGKGIPGSSHQKKLTVSHSYDETLFVQVRFIGEPLEGWVHISPQQFNLSSEEVRNVTVSASIQENASVGNYTGKLMTYFIKE